MGVTGSNGERVEKLDLVSPVVSFRPEVEQSRAKAHAEDYTLPWSVKKIPHIVISFHLLSLVTRAIVFL